MKISSTSHAEQSKGFTLFELVLAMLIAGLLLTAIFQMADGTVKSTHTMVEFQNEDIKREAFFNFLADHFERLPGNATFHLLSTSDSEPYLSEMTFQDAPSSFNWGGVPLSAEATRLVTVPSATGGVDVVLEYYDIAILDGEEEEAEDENADPFASIVLLEDVRLFEWTVLDGRNYNTTPRDEWDYEWDSTTRRPNFVELLVKFSNDEPEVKRLFYIPTKVSPLTTSRQLQNSASGARGGDQQQGGGPQQGGTPQQGGATNPTTGGQR